METVTPRSRYSGTNFTPSGRQCQEKVVNILCSAADRRRESRRIRPQQNPGLAGARLPEAEASSGAHLWSNYEAACGRSHILEPQQPLPFFDAMEHLPPAQQAILPA